MTGNYKKKKLSKIWILIIGIIIISTNYSNVYGKNLPEKKNITIFQTNLNYKEYFDSYNNIYEIINDIEESTLRAYMSTITTTFKGRITGSETCNKAGDWIYNEFNKMPNMHVKKNHWSARSDIFHFFKIYNSFNVEAELPGYSNDSIVFIFSAHYDCDREESPGALDNGAAIAALLASANALSKFEFKYTIKFIAFSGEELKFLGSYDYAKEAYYSGENIAAVLNADVIGNNTHLTNKSHLLRAYSSYPTKWIVDILDYVSNEYNIDIDVEERRYYGHSDDKPFDDYGYGVMQLYQSGNQMEEYFGTANDTIDLINFSYLVNITNCIAAGLAVLADLPTISPRIRINKPKEDSLILKGLNLLNLTKGKTIVLGPINVQADVQSKNGEINKVVFELVKGDNEYTSNNEERPIIANFSDYDPPFEWLITERCFGWNTIRATAFDEEGNFSSDEIEILFFNI